ncbi:MAG: hypothetical protein ACXACY_19175, partial [Candidatus Hodarchaeales archaeon]
MILLLLTAFTTQAQDSCNYYKNEVDEFTGTVKVVMEDELFISHTDSVLLKYYKRKKHQYLETEVYLAHIGKQYAAYFITTIQTDKAYDYYGALYKDSKIMLKMADGTVMNLIFIKTDSGDTDYTAKKTKYSVICVLDEEQIETLSKTMIEKVRVYWSKGYEDY